MNLRMIAQSEEMQARIQKCCFAHSTIIISPRHTCPHPFKLDDISDPVTEIRTPETDEL